MSSGQTPQPPTPPLQSGQPASSSPPQVSYPPSQTAPSQMSSQNSPPQQDPMFNPVAHSQAGLPHLIEYLVQQYRVQIQRINETRSLQGQPLADPEGTIRAARPVLDFFEQFLGHHRPIQVFPIDMNYGIQLDNNDRVALCPGVTDIRGTMQDSGAISISDGRSQPGQDGVVQVNDQRHIQ